MSVAEEQHLFADALRQGFKKSLAQVDVQFPILSGLPDELRALTHEELVAYSAYLERKLFVVKTFLMHP